MPGGAAGRVWAAHRQERLLGYPRSEDGKEDVLPFPDLLNLWRRASEEAKRLGKPDLLFIEDNIDFFREYTRKVQASYERPWPRPWPCGTVWVHWDPRWVEPRKQVLDLANGLFTLKLDCTGLASSRMP